MMFKSLVQRLLLALPVFAACIVPGQRVLALTGVDALSEPDEASVRHALRLLDTDETAQYIAAPFGLREGGGNEVIVYMLGNQWCGSGGCTTLVLAKNGLSWKIVSEVSGTHPPIRVLSEKSHGWHSIGVLVAGGGVTQAYEAVLRFNGKSYPDNATVPPAVPVNTPVGDIVIESEQGAKALYP